MSASENAWTVPRADGSVTSPGARDHGRSEDLVARWGLCSTEASETVDERIVFFYRAWCGPMAIRHMGSTLLRNPTAAFRRRPFGRSLGMQRA